MIEKREKALFKIAMEEPEMCEVIKMLQENDMRNADAINNVVHALEHVTDRTLNSLEKMSDTMNEMGNIISEMSNKIVELEEKIENLESKGDDNMEKDLVQICNDVVKATEEENEDDFMTQYMKLTETLRNEVIEDMKNEKEQYGTEIKEMEYANTYEECQNREVEVLCDDTYEGYRYIILNMCGSHPCAYVEIPEEHPKYGATDRDYWSVGPNEVTYGRNYLTDILSDTWVIGWDYNHSGDYSALCQYGTKWTTAEIIEECKEAIEDLIFMDGDE